MEDRVEHINCRFYEQKFPEVNDLVKVVVRNVAEMGAYVSLLEYNNIEGMILHSELSRRRIRSLAKLIRVGREEVVVVLRVDKEKGFIDLSKRMVSIDDIAKCEEKFTKAKTVHSILRHISNTKHIPILNLYENIGWPLYKKYGHCYDAFKLLITTNPEEVFKGIDYQISPELMEFLLKIVKRRMTPQPVKIRADIEVTCFRYEGIDSIKKALTAGAQCSTEKFPIQIKLVAPPFYVLFTQSYEKETGIELLTNAIEAIDKSITESGGVMSVRTPPRSISEKETDLTQEDGDNEESYSDDDE